MTTYTEYVDGLKKIRRPLPIPEHTAVLYAIMRGSPIATATQDDEALCITFADGGHLNIYDDGQACCENRYMTTDDDLLSFAGAKLVDFDATETTCADDEYGDPHEQMFVRLHTDRGTITLVTHNEHNGYYGGFDVVSQWSETNGQDA